MAADDTRLTRRTTASALVGVLATTGCAPLMQGPQSPAAGFAGPRLDPDALIAADGVRLPMRVWDATDSYGEPAEPWAVIVGLHGMNDYAAAFGLAGPYWSSRGATTYAYDQRGFGRTSERGVWGGAELMAGDLRTACALARARHPHATLAVVGESMGGAVAIYAFASGSPPAADRLVLASPAVWGWREQGLPNDLALWVSAHVAPAATLTAPNWLARRIRASDNVAELRRMGLDRNMIFETRVDAIYGLVNLMQQAQDEIGRVRVPLLYQYGAHDQIIPKGAAFRAVRRLKPDDRSAYYADGWHLLLRDLHRRRALDDALAFIRDPSGSPPSGAPPVPAFRRPTAVASRALG